MLRRGKGLEFSLQSGLWIREALESECGVIGLLLGSQLKLPEEGNPIVYLRPLLWQLTLRSLTRVMDERIVCWLFWGHRVGNLCSSAIQHAK